MFLVDAIDHCQQTTEVDDALAQLDVVIGAKARRIFDVEQRVAASVTLHVLERILTSNGRVAGVELQRNYRRINPLYENIVGSGTVDRAEIPCFVMKAHADIAAQGTGSSFVEAIRPAAIVVEAELLAVGQTGDYQELMSNNVRGFDLGLQVVEVMTSVGPLRERNCSLS